MTKLFSPYITRNVTLKNRIVMSPMAMYAAQEDGLITPWHNVHYISRAIGQVGLIMLEVTAISPEGRISTQDLGIWNDRQVEEFKKLTDGIHATGAKAAIQISHAGRKRQIKGPIYGPSILPFNDQYQTPQALSTADIEKIVEDFKQAAIRAEAAGFDVIEIHAAHGYLINQFLSPLTNQRHDEYGGTPENHYRFLGQVIDAIRSVYAGPLLTRISAKDYGENGLNTEDYLLYTKWMHEQGVDLIDVSTGGVVPADYHTYPGYQVSFSDAIRNGAEVPTGAVGLISTGVQAEEILQNGRADLIFIGRKLLRNPYWPFEAAKELGTTIEPPALYARGWKS